jgi:16S rRNA G527 N7-methylase RsmG
VARSTLDDVWHRHFADSAQLWALAAPSPLGVRVGARGSSPSSEVNTPSPGADEKGGSAVEIGGRAGLSPRGEASSQHFLDLGSGAGFPGLVLAIMAAEHGGTRHTLIESDTRKAAFLREVARETGVAVEIVAGRIELPQTTASVGEVNCVTARALAPLPRLLPLVAPYFGVATVGFLKGRDLAAELENAAAGWAFQSELLPSVTDREGRILRLTGLVQKTRA